MYTREQIEKAVKAKGYKWFEDSSNKGYDVNIVGVRNNAPSIADKVTNVFDDFITISYKDSLGNWQFFCWNATTDAGKKALKNSETQKALRGWLRVNIAVFGLLINIEENTTRYAND